jgi:hypothetical protein
MIMPRPSFIVITTAFLTALTGSASAQQPAVRRLGPREVPAGLEYRGSIEGARRWTDRTGDNVLLLTSFDETRSDDPSVHSREIRAYHYVRRGAGYALLWQIQDFVRECDLDIILEYAPGSLQVTDVDADGIAETSFVYQLGCMGGVDPAGLKLILHEGATKYAIRGFTDLRDLGPTYPAPEMRPDAALQRVPLLRAHAVRQWQRFVRARRWARGPDGEIGPP